jgi:hypothetical protein
MALRYSFELANRRAKRLQASFPKAVSARYDRRRRRVVVGLSSNVEVGFSPRDAQGLESARPSELEEIEISPSGFGLHFPLLDADVYLPAILEGFLGSRKWMASRPDRAGRKSKAHAQVGPDDILVEYDFSHAQPNRYAARYTPRLVRPLNASFRGMPLDPEAPFTLGFSSENACGIHHGDR